MWFFKLPFNMIDSLTTNVPHIPICTSQLICRMDRWLTVLVKDHSFSTFSKFSEKLTFLTPLTHTYMYQGVRNVSLSENFENVLNEWSLTTGALVFNPFSTTVLPLLCPLKTSKSRRFSDVFMEYRRGTLVKNGLIN